MCCSDGFPTSSMPPPSQDLASDWLPAKSHRAIVAIHQQLLGALPTLLVQRAHPPVALCNLPKMHIVVNCQPSLQFAAQAVHHRCQW